MGLNDSKFNYNEGINVDVSGVSDIEELFRKNFALIERSEQIEVNIGITGDSGTGKSSFINVIRGINDDDNKAAKVGVTETTRVPTAYHHRANPKIKFWDLPGIGTPSYPDMETYCKKVELEKYHAFLIFAANRFTENDLKLATKIRSIDKKFFFICTKIDENVRSEKRKGAFNEDKMLEEIRSYCLKNLVGQLRNEKDIFLISNHYPAKWDFKRLIHAILHELCLSESLSS